MKAKVVFSLLFVATLTISGCGKKALEIDPNFEGTWDADVSTMEIYSDGSGRYIGLNGFTVVDVSGPVKIKGGDKLKIGLKKLQINEFPKETTDGFGNDVWTMVLDGDTYIKY